MDRIKRSGTREGSPFVRLFLNQQARKSVTDVNGLELVMLSTSPGHRKSARPRSSTRIIRRALVATRRDYHEGSLPTLRHLLAPLGADATVLTAAFLALPFLSPVSLGPVTTPASLLIALLGWQVLRQREQTPLPARLLDASVPQRAHRAMSTVVRHAHRWMHRISRPRLLHLVEGQRGRIVCGIGILVGAVLLAVPIPLLPLTNTFPALGVLLFALGWLERDGLLTVLGSASLAVAVAVFAALGAAVALVGWEVVHGAIPIIGGRQVRMTRAICAAGAFGHGRRPKEVR